MLKTQTTDRNKKFKHEPSAMVLKKINVQHTQNMYFRINRIV